MTLYSIMGGADQRAYTLAFGTANQQAQTKTEAYHSPPSLAEIYSVYGAQVYVGLQEKRQENKDECNRWKKARGDTTEYYAG